MKWKRSVSVILCLFISPLSQAAVAVDANLVTPSDSATSPITNTTLTVGSGSNRALVVQICYIGAVQTVTVKWDSTGTNQSVNLIKTATDGSNDHTCELYGLVAPTSGNKTLSVTFTGGKETTVSAVSFTGVDQTGGTTSFPNSASNTGNSNTSSVSVTSAVGNETVDVTAAGILAALNSTSATQSFILHGFGQIESGGSYTAGSASNSMTGAYSQTDVWITVGTDILAFGTAPTAPTVTTQNVSALSYTTATGNGNATSDGGATITDTGVCWATHASPTSSDTCASSGAGGTGAFTAAITGLSPNTVYHVVGYATNSAGTAYGNDVLFLTLNYPSISTTPGTGNISTTNGLGIVNIK